MKLTLQGAMGAAKAAAEAFKGNVEPASEIQRRAEICCGPVTLEKSVFVNNKTYRSGKYAQCPFKVPVKGIESRVSKLMGDLSRKHDVPPEIAESMCAVCGCGFSLLLPTLKSKVHVDTPKQLSQRPSNCWLKQINEEKLK